jgi:hypothetical protein
MLVMKMSRLLLVLLFAVPLAADPIGDVRAALGRFPARENVRAAYELQRTVKNEGKFGNDNYIGKAGVEIEATAAGYQIVVGHPVLDQVVRERQAHDANPKLPTPTANALHEINALGTADVLDLGPVILRLLDGAKLVSEAAGTWAGKPARVLVLRAADRLDDDDAGKVKVAENKVTLWLDSENVPQAVEHMFAAKFSFLFLKGESRQKTSWHVTRAADRLVRARYEYTQTTSGMGQKGLESVVATVRVH